MFDRRRHGNGIETYRNGKDWQSWKPFLHTSMLQSFVIVLFDAVNVTARVAQRRVYHIRVSITCAVYPQSVVTSGATSPPDWLQLSSCHVQSIVTLLSSRHQRLRDCRRQRQLLSTTQLLLYRSCIGFQSRKDLIQAVPGCDVRLAGLQVITYYSIDCCCLIQNLRSIFRYDLIFWVFRFCQVTRTSRIRQNRVEYSYSIIDYERGDHRWISLFRRSFFC